MTTATKTSTRQDGHARPLVFAPSLTAGEYFYHADPNSFGPRAYYFTNGRAERSDASPQPPFSECREMISQPNAIK